MFGLSFSGAMCEAMLVAGRVGLNLSSRGMQLKVMSSCHERCTGPDEI